jgi:hypothetical protein
MCWRIMGLETISLGLRNREIFGSDQGIEVTEQGSVAADQGKAIKPRSHIGMSEHEGLANASDGRARSRRANLDDVRLGTRRRF